MKSMYTGCFMRVGTTYFFDIVLLFLSVVFILFHCFWPFSEVFPRYVYRLFVYFNTSCTIYLRLLLMLLYRDVWRDLLILKIYIYFTFRCPWESVESLPFIHIRKKFTTAIVDLDLYTYTVLNLVYTSFYTIIKYGSQWQSK